MAGRGQLFYKERPVPLRRPGEGAKSQYSLLVNKLQSLDLSETSNDIDGLAECERLFATLCTSQETLNTILMKLHEVALSDPLISYNVAQFIGCVTGRKEIENVSVRSEFFRLLQVDFEVRKENAEKDRSKYLNAIILLSEIVETVRVCGRPLDVLCTALIDYLNEIKDDSQEDALELLVQILVVNGKTLQDVAPKNIKEFYCSLRELVVKPHPRSEKSRCWLLLAIEYNANSLKLPEDEIRNFYFRVLGNSYKNIENRALHGFGNSILPTKSVDSKIPTEKLPTEKLPAENDDEAMREAVRQRMREKGLLPSSRLRSELQDKQLLSPQEKAERPRTADSANRSFPDASSK